MVSENPETQTGKIGNPNTISSFLFDTLKGFRVFENFRNIPQRGHDQNPKLSKEYFWCLNFLF